MEQYRLIVSENYHRDIKNILHYISHNLGSPSTALELLDEVENSLSSLSTLPYRFNLSDDAYLNSKKQSRQKPTPFYIGKHI